MHAFRPLLTINVLHFIFIIETFTILIFNDTSQIIELAFFSHNKINLTCSSGITKQRLYKIKQDVSSLVSNEKEKRKHKPHNKSGGSIWTKGCLVNQIRLKHLKKIHLEPSTPTDVNCKYSLSDCPKSEFMNLLCISGWRIHGYICLNSQLHDNDYCITLTGC